MKSRGSVNTRSMLVVEDEADMLRALSRVLVGWRVHGVGTMGKASDELENAAFDGAIVDVGLPDGCGLDLVESIRRRALLIPILVLTAHCDPALVNRAQRCGAEYACKPLLAPNVLAFAARAAAWNHAEDDVNLRVAELARRHGLTPREREVALLAARDLPRHAIQTELGVSINTVKTQVRSLLRKCGAPSLAALRRGLLAPRDARSSSAA